MRSAGLSLIKEFKLLDENRIRYLEGLPKKRRDVQIGLYERKDKELAKQMKEHMKQMRKWFFEGNGLKDEDILSIKNDALFVFKRCHQTEFSENILFAEKNAYSSYYNINKLEFYYGADRLHIKGINDELLIRHKEYMLEFLHDLFTMMERSPRKKVMKTLKDFAYYYKRRELHIGYYRELNAECMFRLEEKLSGIPVGIVNLKDKDKLIIEYNYINYIIPLISIVV